MPTSPPVSHVPARAVTPAYVVLAVADAALAGLGARRLRRVTKPALMPVLARGLLAATRRGPGRPRAVTATLAAQVLSGGGDVALLGRGDAAFLTGLSSFLAGHGAYVVAFGELRRDGVSGRTSDDASDGSDRLERVGPAVAGAAYAVLGPVLGRAARRASPGLRVPVLVYGGALCAMVATASRVGPAVGREARRRLVAGSVLFLVSDGVLGTREFVLAGDDATSRRRRGLDVVVMATYTAAQGLIADGVARAQDAGTSRT